MKSFESIVRIVASGICARTGGEVGPRSWLPRLRSRSLGPGLCSAFLLVLGGFLAGPLAAMHPNHPVGVDPERAFLTSPENIDRVDLYSGSLSVTIPIGPFSLLNTSNVWHYRTHPQSGELLARPNWKDTAGIGWHLGWGEVYHPDHEFNQTGEWLYVDENNSRHALYRKLHRDDGDDGDGTANNVFYSRDGSYLRMRLSETDCRVAYIEEPDGTTRMFVGTCGSGTTKRIEKIWSPFSSEADPDVTISYGVDPAHPLGSDDTLRTVTNRYGLTHKVHLSDLMNNDPNDPVHWVERIVTKVDLEGFNGQRAVYDFSYGQFNLDRSCKADAGGRIAVPHLERVDLPDGTSYSMVENGNFLYENLCRWIDGHKVDDLPGVLTGLNLPTGGKIRWTYQRYEFPPGDTTSVFNTGAGVKTRTLHTAGATATSSNAVGTWTYKTSSVPPMDTGVPGEPTHPEMHMEVVYPTGDCTKHYFDAIYWVDPVNSAGTPWGWERGLPFVYSEAVDGRFLSSQVYGGNDGNGSCDPATKLRSTYLRFRHDATPGNGSDPQSEWTNTNRQVEARRTVFHDDGDGYVDTEFSDFDGLGNFRQAVHTSNFGASQLRQTTTDYNRSNGTYPGSYTALQISEPWILGVFSSVEVSEPGATGVQVSKAEYSFEDSTGFLTCTRALASGTARGPSDLLGVRLRDSLGRVTDEKSYGGDTQSLSTGGSQCGTVPAQPAYWTHHDYDPLSGALVRSRPKTPAGADGPFLVYDADVEARTGFVLRERDPAGFEAAYDYDQAGRLVSVTPQQGAVAAYTYVNPTASATGRVETRLQTPGAPPTTLVESQLVLDDFGRPRLNRKKLPGGVWSERETTYNPRGWTASVSEWGDLSKKTEFLNFDPFGRSTVVRPPDGSTHDIVHFYRGARVFQETKKVALAGGEAPVTKTYLYDGFGRLERVGEHSGPTGGEELTDYSYDVAGRLTSSQAGVQTRSWVYDGRGFLLSETHPEKGASGSGTVTYRDYDAAGLPGGMTDGPHNLGFTYDFMGRALATRDLNQGSRLVKELKWDGSHGLGEGKLQWAKRYNYVDLPWNPAGEEAVVVKQTFGYLELGGATSVKNTRVQWSSPDAVFQQTYSYDDLGNMTELNYPACTTPTECTNSGPGSGPGLQFTYDQGLLTAVPGWASAITYHSSGLRQRIDHANGVSEHLDRDSHFSRRPRRLYTSGVLPAFDSGVMSYDGAGNLKAMGNDVFVYDKVSRLASASYDGGGFVQSFTYDRWGNLTSMTGDTAGMEIFPVDAATNRLVGATYDGAGNLLQPPAAPGLSGTFEYDTANRVTSQNTQLYLYDAFGERTVSIVNFDQGEARALFHLRDLNHRLVSNIRLGSDGWTRERDYFFAGGRLLGRTSSEASQPVRHFHLDHLGSVRLATLADGSYATENTFMPYGERFGPGSTADSLLFAEPHERDFSAETDYMHARHYWWKLGRFHSPDPVQGSPGEPQSWNRYAYVMGNPLNLVDPTGLDSDEFVQQVESDFCPDPCEEIIVVDEVITVFGKDPLSQWSLWGSLSSQFGGLSSEHAGDFGGGSAIGRGFSSHLTSSLGLGGDWNWERVRATLEWLATASAAAAASQQAIELGKRSAELRSDYYRLAVDIFDHNQPKVTVAKAKIAQQNAVNRSRSFFRSVGRVGWLGLWASAFANSYGAGASRATQDYVRGTAINDIQSSYVRFLQDRARATGNGTLPRL